MSEVRDFVADKLVLLKQALAAETKRREAVEQQAAENSKRRTELEAALGEIQRVQDTFQQELEIADNPKQLLELESALAESQQARETLEGELEAARRELQALGIEKGKPFQPDARQNKLLTEAAFVGEQMAKANSFDKRFPGSRYRNAANWEILFAPGILTRPEGGSLQPAR